jgi:multidrug resistance efflux pump
MDFADYPLAIAKLERQLLRTSQAMRRSQADLEKLQMTIEQAIAADLDLKDEQQRKARRLELITGNDFQNAQQVLQTHSDRRAELDIELQLLRNQFTVAKLEKREAIAQAENTPFKVARLIVA